jgi:hypothetical protein
MRPICSIGLLLICTAAGCSNGSIRPAAASPAQKAQKAEPSEKQDVDGKNDQEDAKRKREAREKLLLLEKEQTQKQADLLAVTTRKELEIIKRCDEQLKQLDKDWEAGRVSTFDSSMRKVDLKREGEFAQERFDKFLRVMKEHEEKLNDIDRQLKELYEEALRD